MFLLYFLPDCTGQLVVSLPDDDINEILYHNMPNTWEKKMIEQGFNSLACSIHSTVEFFEIRIENLEKSITSSVPSTNRKKNKKCSKKIIEVTFERKDVLPVPPRMRT